MEACDACHSVYCPDKHLCDVDLTNVRPSDPRDPETAKAEIAKAWGTGEFIACDGELVADWTLQRSATTAWGSGRQPVLDLLQGGATIEQAAQQLGAPLSDVVSVFTQIGSTSIEGVLAVERSLRAGAASYLAVARETGVSDQFVGRIADVICVHPKTAHTLESGGGYKYTAEQIAEVLRLKSETSLTNAQIGETIGYLSGDQVKAIHRRHAAKAAAAQTVDIPVISVCDNSRQAETVAA